MVKISWEIPIAINIFIYKSLLFQFLRMHYCSWSMNLCLFGLAIQNTLVKQFVITVDYFFKSQIHFRQISAAIISRAWMLHTTTALRVVLEGVPIQRYLQRLDAEQVFFVTLVVPWQIVNFDGLIRQSFPQSHHQCDSPIQGHARSSLKSLSLSKQQVIARFSSKSTLFSNIIFMEAGQQSCPKQTILDQASRCLTQKAAIYFYFYVQKV